MTDTELVDAPPPATDRPWSLRSLAPEAAAAPPLDLSLSAVDEITPPVEGESVAPSPAASSFSEIEPTAETLPSLETADDVRLHQKLSLRLSPIAMQKRLLN